MLGQGAAEDAEIAQALGVTGYFLGEKLAKTLGGKPLPQARARLVEELARRV